MRARVSPIAFAVTVVGATVVSLGLIIGVSDGESAVAPRDLSSITVDRQSTSTRPTGPERSVPAQSPTVESPVEDATRVVLPDLVQVTGVVQRDDDDLVLSGVDSPTAESGPLELDAGPDRWVRTTIAPSDVDGDGIVEPWWEELIGLVGREVTVFGLIDDGDLDIFVIDGVSLRAPYSEVPPWADDWSSDGLPAEVVEQLESGINGDEAVRLALSLVPGIVIDAEIEVNDGRPYWEVDVRAADGAVYDVEIDAITAEVVELERR